MGVDEEVVVVSQTLCRFVALLKDNAMIFSVPQDTSLGFRFIKNSNLEKI